MRLWSERIQEREVFEVIGCERVPLNESLNEIVVLLDEYTKRGDYRAELFDDVFNYYHNRILTNDEFIDGVARIKLGLDTRNHAKEWLLEVVNWFAGNRRDLRDEEIKLGNRLRDWYHIGVSLVIPKYVGSVGHVEFEEPGNSGYFSGECFNKRGKYKKKKYGSKISKSRKFNPSIEKKKEKWAELLNIIFGSKNHKNYDSREKEKNWVISLQFLP